MISGILNRITGITLMDDTSNLKKKAASPFILFFLLSLKWIYFVIVVMSDCSKVMHFFINDRKAVISSPSINDS